MKKPSRRQVQRKARLDGLEDGLTSLKIMTLPKEYDQRTFKKKRRMI